MPKASRVTNIRATMTLICLRVFMSPLGARRFLAAAGIGDDAERVVLSALRDLAGLDGDVAGGIDSDCHGVHWTGRRARHQDAALLGVGGAVAGTTEPALPAPEVEVGPPGDGAA